jgi:hypothetical protein
MSTMIVDWPRAWWQPRGGQFSLASRSQSSKAPWTMSANVYGPHVQYWRASLPFQPLKDADAAEREALLESLGGQAGLIRIGAWARRMPLYNADVIAATARFTDGSGFTGGAAFSSGLLPPAVYCAGAASYGGMSVVIGGLPASTLRVLRRGDHVEFQRGGTFDATPSLHRVTRDAPTDAAGLTRIEIVPPLRKGLSVGDSVVLHYPASVFRLADDDQGAFDRDVNAFGTHGMSLVEALI